MSVLSKNEKPLALFEFTQGLDVDIYLAAAEVQVQKAWANALGHADVLTSDEALQACVLLDEALDLIQKDEFDWQVKDEDIHMNLERFITERAGDLGKKMHLGRSRNDLIATTLRLFTAQMITDVLAQSQNVASALLQTAEENLDVIIPGLTHLQHGQPVRLAQALLAHVQASLRDDTRLKAAKTSCLAHMPLGAAAFAGTTISLNFENLATELGFAGPCQNGYDAVGDRDFILETLNAISLKAVHMARFCEEIMYLSGTAIGVINLPEDWSTGSSIMPNKRNPDVPELIRAKASRLVALANEGAGIVKAVTPSYGSDLHELKRTLITAWQETLSCLTVLEPFCHNLTVNAERAKELLNGGHVLATEIANDYVSGGENFREAYGKVKDSVAEADAQGKQIHDVIHSSHSFEEAVEKRDFPGGTSKKQIQKQIEDLKHALFV